MRAFIDAKMHLDTICRGLEWCVVASILCDCFYARNPHNISCFAKLQQVRICILWVNEIGIFSVSQLIQYLFRELRNCQLSFEFVCQSNKMFTYENDSIRLTNSVLECVHSNVVVGEQTTNSKLGAGRSSAHTHIHTIFRCVAHREDAHRFCMFMGVHPLDHSREWLFVHTTFYYIYHNNHNERECVPEWVRVMLLLYVHVLKWQ